MTADNFLEEWKLSVETSMKFDEILVDLRKYGFTLITGLLTAGSFLGFTIGGDSVLNQVAYANILHIGVITVTMFLVVILFWLDIYYQNLLYGSVIRTRFLEFSRLKQRLSIYISGIYTGSSMEFMLYAIYGGFLLGTFSLGIIVAGITTQSTAISTSNVSATMSSSNGKAFESQTITQILSGYLQSSLGILALSFILSAIGMIAIGVVCLRSRNDKVKKIDTKIKTKIEDPRRVGTTVDDTQIMAVEREILDIFPFKT
jgi:hypothetical protein